MKAQLMWRDLPIDKSAHWSASPSSLTHSSEGPMVKMGFDVDNGLGFYDFYGDNNGNQTAKLSF